MTNNAGLSKIYLISILSLISLIVVLGAKVVKSSSSHQSSTPSYIALTFTFTFFPLYFILKYSGSGATYS